MMSEPKNPAQPAPPGERSSPSGQVSTPDVSVIIVTYNSAEDILQCVKGAKMNTIGCTIEFIILDNCSKDSTIQIIKENLPYARLILPQKNLGFAKGVNKAAKEAKGKYILLLNPDTTIFSNAIGKVFEFAGQNPQYGLYGARTLKRDNTLQPTSCLGLPTIWSHFMFALGLSTIFKHNIFFDPESLGKWDRSTTKKVGSIVGCFLLCKKTLWNELEGFDERFFMYGEDVDLAIRCAQKGLRSIHCADAELIHEFGNSSETPLHKRILLFTGKVTLEKKHRIRLLALLNISLLKTGVLLRSILNDEYKSLWSERKKWSAGYSK